MALITSAGATLSTSETYSALASAAVAASALSAVPDYHLPWSGPLVEEALQKIMDLDLADVGGIKILESTEESPVDLNAVTTPGEYTMSYVEDGSVPEELQGINPIKVWTYTDDDGNVYQIIEGLGDRWTRFSSDDGASWSTWAAKPFASGGIDVSEDPEEEQPNPLDTLEASLTDVRDRVAALENLGNANISTGSEAAATAMLNGTFDYDNPAT